MSGLDPAFRPPASHAPRTALVDWWAPITPVIELLPASIAGLPATSAIVWVGPPLFARPGRNARKDADKVAVGRRSRARRRWRRLRSGCSRTRAT